MTTNSPQPTAKIYQFPLARRLNKPEGADELGDRNSVRAAPPIVSVGSAWYHDEAIEEARHARER